MSRKKKQLPLFENVTITDVAAEGKSLVRIDDLVVFVPFCVPGDVVDLQIRRKKHSYAEAEVVKFRKLSDVRAVPPCKHFGVCGGCKWQNLPYEEQIKFKQEQVMQQLRRIGKVELPECMPILGSKKIWEYRNKLEYGFADKRYLTREEMNAMVPFSNGCGFHVTGAFDKILHIEKCHLMDDFQNTLRNTIYEYAREHEIELYNLREQHGLLRDMMIRNSNTGEWMLLIQFGATLYPEGVEHDAPKKGIVDGYFEEEKAMALMEFLAQRFPEITSLLWTYNPKFNDTFGDLEVHVYKGNDHIYETMEDLRFKVGPKSFYQTNTDQAYELYSVARNFAYMNIADEEKPLVYDLYTGTGTIANFVAKRARQVIGIEYVPEAIEDAKVNSKINGIDNTLFYAGDMKDILTDDFIKQHGRPDIIITDPPRAGMHPDVVNVILNAKPKRIVYVSCNPATQARDLQLLDVQYRVAAIQPVDMFPHTPHVENVVMLEIREQE